MEPWGNTERSQIMKRISHNQFVFLLALILIMALVIGAADYKPIVLDSTYDHDKWETEPNDIIREFRAYTVSFDSKDDDMNMGVPEWVAHEIKPHPQPLGTAPDRPRPWLTDTEEGLAPTDDSYKNSGYDRGHMCMKYIAWRLGANARLEHSHDA